MKEQTLTYWIVWQVVIVWAIIYLLFPGNSASTVYTRQILPLLLLFASLYVLSYFKEYVELYKGSVSFGDKAYIVFTISLPIIYCICYVINMLR